MRGGEAANLDGGEVEGWRGMWRNIIKMCADDQGGICSVVAASSDRYLH